jgi:hypothetical protein
MDNEACQAKIASGLAVIRKDPRSRFVQKNPSLPMFLHHGDLCQYQLVLACQEQPPTVSGYGRYALSARPRLKRRKDESKNILLALLACIRVSRPGPVDGTRRDP